MLSIYFDRVSLCSSGCGGTHYVDQARLKLSLSLSPGLLGLKACATMPGFVLSFEGLASTEIKYLVENGVI